MTPTEKKAREIFERFSCVQRGFVMPKIIAKQCALICVENEYHSLREQLFNLRSCGVIESEKTYLARLEQLINDEQEVKNHIQKL